MDGARDTADVVAIVEEAIAELDAGRIDAARARFRAFVAAVRGRRGESLGVDVDLRSNPWQQP